MTREEKHQANLDYRKEYMKKKRQDPAYQAKQREYERRYEERKRLKIAGRDKVVPAFATTWTNRAHFMHVNEEGGVILPLSELLIILNETGANYKELYHDGKFGIEVML